MTRVSKATLKSYFNMGDVVTEDNFVDFIDTLWSTHPVKGDPFTFYICLISQADTDIFQVNPTLAIGDVKISGDGGGLVNITTLPIVTPAGSKIVKVDLSGAETNYDDVVVLLSDQAGNEWQDCMILLKTDP